MWDGTFNGKDIDPAVFIYYAKIKVLGKEGIYKGNVTLIR